MQATPNTEGSAERRARWARDEIRALHDGRAQIRVTPDREFRELERRVAARRPLTCPTGPPPADPAALPAWQDQHRAWVRDTAEQRREERELERQRSLRKMSAAIAADQCRRLLAQLIPNPTRRTAARGRTTPTHRYTRRRATAARAPAPSSPSDSDSRAGDAPLDSAPAGPCTALPMPARLDPAHFVAMLDALAGAGVPLTSQTVTAALAALRWSSR